MILLASLLRDESCAPLVKERSWPFGSVADTRRPYLGKPGNNLACAVESTLNRGMILCRLRIAVLFALVAPFIASADDLSSSTWSPVTPGLDYLHVHDTNHPWSIHIARLDRSHQDFEIVSTHAKNQITALGTVVSQVAELPRDAGKPLVAINGDFFVIAKGPYQGDPLGLQIASGELISAPGGASFWAEPGGKFHAGKVESGLSVTWPRGGKSHVGLNESRSNGIVLFTPTFGSSTRTTNGLELVLEKVAGKDWLPLHADHTYSARVREVRTNADTALTPATMVISITPKLAPSYTAIHPGTELQISTGTTPDVSAAQTAVGGRPLLILNGKMQSVKEAKGTNGVAIRAPRTAIGWNNQYFYFVVIDGRQKELSMGMTFGETATFMKELGCSDAINLDGGGSTTFWMDGKVLNSPSDKHERTVANALILVKHEGKVSQNDAPAK